MYNIEALLENRTTEQGKSQLHLRLVVINNFESTIWKPVALVETRHISEWLTSYISDHALKTYGAVAVKLLSFISSAPNGDE